MNLLVTSTHQHVSVMWIEDSVSYGIAEASNLNATWTWYNQLQPDCSEWYLNRLKVDPKGQGHGSELLKKLLEALTLREDFDILLLEPGGYGSDVDRLIKFYERHGFVLNEERDVWIWSRRIEQSLEAGSPI